MRSRRITHEQVSSGVLLAISCCALGACFPTNRAVGGGPSSPVTSPRPDSFEAHVDHALAELDRRVHHDVANGRLGADALDELHRREDQIREQLAAAKNDGFIDESERRQIEHGIRSSSRVTDPGSYDHPGFARHYLTSRWNWEQGFW